MDLERPSFFKVPGIIQLPAILRRSRLQADFLTPTYKEGTIDCLTNSSGVVIVLEARGGGLLTPINDPQHVAELIVRLKIGTTFTN